MTEIVSKTASMYPFKIEGDRPWYLLLRRGPGRKLPGAWQAVHGHVEKGETAAETAKRELVEETELEPVTVWTVDYLEHSYDARKDEIRLVPCFAALVAGEVKLSGEHDASRWLSAREAASLFTFENQRAALAILDRDIGRIVARGGEPSPFLRIVQSGPSGSRSRKGHEHQTTRAHERPEDRPPRGGRRRDALLVHRDERARRAAPREVPPVQRAGDRRRGDGRGPARVARDRASDDACGHPA